MKTIIISRFNIYIEKFREMANLTDENFALWCAKRVRLFEEFTLPSVQRQSFRHFKWIIGFDTVMTPEVSALIEKLRAQKNIIPLVVDNRRGSREGFLAALKRVIYEISGDEKVLTVRLDTDDVVHQDFLSLMQNAAVAASKRDIVPCVINPIYGSQFSGRSLYAYIYNNNPFLGVLEQADADMKTAFGFSHFDADRHLPVRQVSSAEPLWMQVIHDGNAANELKPDLIELIATDRLRAALML